MLGVVELGGSDPWFVRWGPAKLGACKPIFVLLITHSIITTSCSKSSQYFNICAAQIIGYTILISEWNVCTIKYELFIDREGRSNNWVCKGGKWGKKGYIDKTFSCRSHLSHFPPFCVKIWKKIKRWKKWKSIFWPANPVRSTCSLFKIYNNCC